jgi:hypothetical protein
VAGQLLDGPRRRALHRQVRTERVPQDMDALLDTRNALGAADGFMHAMIAREPGEQRPKIRAWLPPRFLPPQVTVASRMPSTETIGVRMLGSRAVVPPLSDDDVLFWRNDFF